MSGHTKGPWHVAGADEDTEGEILIQSSDGWYVATTCDGAKPEGSEIHNARLIAAAPEMLEALRSVAGYLAAVGRSAMGDLQSGTGISYRELMAVITKAEGK